MSKKKSGRGQLEKVVQERTQEKTLTSLNDNKYVINENNTDVIAFLPRFEIDPPTMKQIKQMVIHPAIIGSKVRIMPDCHRGTGCCIGFTYTLNERPVPNFVGGDIACGILSYPISKNILKHSLTKIEKLVKKSVKMGTGHDNIWDQPIVSDEDMNNIFNESYKHALEFSEKYEKKFGKNIAQYIPKYDTQWLKNKCQQVGANYESDVLCCLGTLGGGNHFIELDQDDDDSLYITVHCGSRSFGSDICRFHQKKIIDNRKFPVEDYNNKIKNIHRKCKDSKTIKHLTDQIKQEIEDNKHPIYLENEEAYEYYMDMIFCQNYARLNRRLILKIILNLFDIKYDEQLIIESIHNYIDFNDFIVRKGAISAYEGQKCIIALNMKDGILLCEGKSNSNWNYSCAHGCGRALPRGKASRSLTMKNFIKEMENVCTTSVSLGTLDESPMAYKDSDFVKNLIGDSVTIIKSLRSIINWKAPN